MRIVFDLATIETPALVFLVQELERIQGEPTLVKLVDGVAQPLYEEILRRQGARKDASPVSIEMATEAATAADSCRLGEPLRSLPRELGDAGWTGAWDKRDDPPAEHRPALQPARARQVGIDLLNAMSARCKSAGLDPEAYAGGALCSILQRLEIPNTTPAVASAEGAIRAAIETFELPTPEAGAVFCGPEHPAA